jgi:hypothetical protein
LKQLGLAMLNYESARKQLPLAYTENYCTPTDSAVIGSGTCPGSTKPGNTCNGLPEFFVLTFILPYMENQALYDQIDTTSGTGLARASRWNWNKTVASPTKGTINANVTNVDVPDFLCPSAESRPGKATTDYYTMVDITDSAYCAAESLNLMQSKRQVDRLVGLLQDTPTSLKKCTDGLSKTFLFFESAGRPLNFGPNRAPITTATNVVNGEMTKDYHWAEKGVYAVWGNGLDPACNITNAIMNCNNYQGLYSFHTSGGNELMGDGSVTFLSESVSLDAFISLYTRAADDIATNQ